MNAMGLARESQLTECIERFDNELVKHLNRLVDEGADSSFTEQLPRGQTQSLIDLAYEVRIMRLLVMEQSSYPYIQILRCHTVSESGGATQAVFSKSPI